MKITIKAECVNRLTNNSVNNIKRDIGLAEKRLPELQRMVNDKKEGAHESLTAVVNGVRRAREFLSIAQDLNDKTKYLPADCDVELSDNEIMSLSFSW